MSKITLKYVILLIFGLGFFSNTIYAEPVTLIVDNGPSDNRVDIVFVGDGYTATEQAKFVTDVENAVAYYFGFEPYKDYASYFNARSIALVSNESGADHPENNIERDTALNATYNCAGILRLICVDVAETLNVINRSVDATQQDIIVVMVNDPQYGGSGGRVAVASTNSAANDLVIHEVGHSFGLLADEYDYGNCNNGFEPSELNVTSVTDRNSIKWNAGGGPPLGWIEFSTPVPTSDTVPGQPGLYEGARYCADGIYRPTYNSAMRNLGRPFDAINEELLVRRMYAFMSPLETSLPAGDDVTLSQGDMGEFSVQTTNSESLSVNVTWLVDGVVAGSGASYSLNSADYSVGIHTVVANIEDTNQRVRNDPDGLLTVDRSWTLTIEEGDGELPGATTLISPSGDIDTSTPVYSWNAVAEATRYLLSVANSSGTLIEQRFSSAEAGCDSGAVCTVQPTTVVAGTAQWRVQTENDTGVGPWSNTLAFSVIDRPLTATVDIISVAAGEGDGTADVTVALSNAIRAACKVTVFSRPGTATPGKDYFGATHVLEFAAGEVSKSVSFTVLVDAVKEADEQFTVTQKIGSANCLPGSDGVVTIVNDDRPIVTPRVRVESTEVSEAIGSVAVTVSLSEPGSETCSVRISSRRDSATPGQDYFGSTQVLQFKSGETEKTVKFTILDDTVKESSEQFTVGQAATVNCIQGKDASVLILDNDV